MRRLAPVVAAIAAVALTGAAPQASFNDIEDEVMCVTCNVPLIIAQSPQAERERAEIRRLIAQGLTKDEVKDRLVDSYGTNVLAMPRGDGIGAATYAVPAAVGAALLAGLALFVRRWRRGGAPGRPAAPERRAPPLAPADARRLDEDLARYDA